MELGRDSDTGGQVISTLNSKRVKKKSFSNFILFLRGSKSNIGLCFYMLNLGEICC